MNRNLRGRSGLFPNHFKSPLARPFKSPASTGKACENPKAVEENPEEKIESLKKKLASVRSEITDLEESGHKEEELQEHIEKLHEYNEVKDAVSIVLGRLAVIEGVQTKDLYQRYGLELTD